MKFYWEINPEDLLKNGNYEKNNLSECAYNLMIMYNKYAEKGKKLQQSINSKNFKKNIEQLLEIEAILSEIQFYLEEINGRTFVAFFNFELSIKYNTLSCKNFIRCFSF
ncbi:hypothetical protein OLL93_02175 [Enterococcus faecalis]|uniref:hypothetical protein n=1 Tax=Enterococcus faecalis TaxID=1351 RepID=UPI0022218ED6|nr:hypothetical protein [Enterococcus faecalis]UYY28145.1 hypothetical protein OLL90_02185 [Enterococcus faecalis]UYY30940.1 hypothetical protein OLM04_02175 [Enterococcus faecalis]UYY47517.1 hypothetical protein OLL93_02175 [Enterococcus faecalis]